MEINANSSVGSAPSHEFLVGQATQEANKVKLSTTQEKAPSSPSNEDVIISSTGAQLSARAEASEESNSENDSEQSREANKTADATRLESQSSQSTEEFSPEDSLNKLNDAIQESPDDVYSAQANVTGSLVEALFV